MNVIGRWACVMAMSFAGLLGCTGPRGSGATDPPRAKVEVLLTEALPVPPATEGRMLTVTYPPGAVSPPHRHDGAVFAYVVDGAVVTALDDGGEQRFEAGQGWYERPGQLHRVSRNASGERPAKLVVVFLTQPGAPVLRMEH